jgi:hypothetical protein
MLHRFAYHALRESHIITGLLAAGLVRTPGISQHCELHGSLRTALSQPTHLDPVCSHLLIGSNHEVVAFSCGPHNISIIGRIVGDFTTLYKLYSFFSGRLCSKISKCLERNTKWPRRNAENHEEVRSEWSICQLRIYRAFHESEPLADELILLNVSFFRANENEEQLRQK